MSAKFITGTGTDIGKTWLSCALLRHWRACGLTPQAFKPVVSGYSLDTAGTSDVGQLLAALGRSCTVDEQERIAPWRFVAPLSPDMAAAQENRRIDFAALVDYTRRHTSADSCAGHPVLVEGVGGVMVPLDDCHTVRDWIAASGLPAVLVAGSYLGSLSHTLTALEALVKVGVDVTAIALNESLDSPVDLAQTADVLMRHVDVPVVSIARREPTPGIVRLANLWM